MMQRKTTLIALSLLLSVGLAACNKPGPAEQAGKTMDQAASDAGKKVGDTVDKVENTMSKQVALAEQAVDDTAITAKVKNAILPEPGLKSLQISVDTINGVVMLSGTVDTQAHSHLAQSLAAAVNGVKEVNNQLVVTANK